MSTNHKIHLIEIPSGGSGGRIWNLLHSEREDICEAILKECRTECGAEGAEYERRDTVMTNWHQELLQARLRKIDDALDRLMSGSYGNCSKCGQGIEDAKLEFDPAIAFCPACWERVQDHTRPIGRTQNSRDVANSNGAETSSQIEVAIETLQPFDTILIRTLNSDYRIWLLDPKTGRALVEGGHYLTEPREALLSGSKLHGSQFKLGSIVVGYHLEMWVDRQTVSTSRVQSISVEHCDSAESIEFITEAMHST